MENEALLVLKAAWDRGINTIDTANTYSNGESERYQIPRNQILIFTKCYGIVARSLEEHVFLDPAQRNKSEYINQFGLSRAAIFNAVDASLQRLNTPYVDMLQIHRFDPETPAEETMKALHDLVQSGKVRYIGASSMRCWQFAHLNLVAERNGWTKFIRRGKGSVDSALRSDLPGHAVRLQEREMNAYCNFNGIGLIPPASSNATLREESSAALGFGRALSETDKKVIGRVEEIATKKGCTMAQVALTWVQMKVSSPIVGITSITRLTDLITLDEAEVKYIEKPHEPKGFEVINEGGYSFRVIDKAIYLQRVSSNFATYVHIYL
ncbi:hypothetical protein D9757_012024 [Collybiopsis confluens]|uniref:NADP-dependent oxidoreductase domain-containing protein n=1 Tax=Collybiopsis confluens TaxID=2823264 RepID=A0A8H5GSU0_9AGAR|nr:hypothetical protein D9757_012024 [Collybiopsis confluens]